MITPLYQQAYVARRELAYTIISGELGFLTLGFEKRTFRNSEVHPQEDQVMTHDKPLRQTLSTAENITKNSQTNTDERGYRDETV